jgi:hypothetical protein
MGQTAIGRPRLTPRFEDTSPTVFDTFGQSLARRGKGRINTLLDLLSGSTPEEEAQNAVFSLMPGGMVVGPVRRGISQAAGPTTRRLLGRPKGITAYHGTPHRFSRTDRNPLGQFDLEKLGTGEGDAYGRGFYFAEEPATAQFYREQLAGPPGTFYEVNIQASPEELLNLEVPLKGQSLQVRGALEDLQSPWQRHEQTRLSRSLSEETHPTQRGVFSNWRNWQSIRPGGGEQELRRLGIPGLKYLDPMSRGSRGPGYTPTSNYVIWDPERLNIIKRVIAAIGAVGGGTLAATGQEPDVRRPEL